MDHKLKESHYGFEHAKATILYSLSNYVHTLLNFFFLINLIQANPAGTPGYRNGTESFFCWKGRPSVVWDV